MPMVTIGGVRWSGVYLFFGTDPSSPPRLYCHHRTAFLTIAPAAPQMPPMCHNCHTTTTDASAIPAAAAKLSPPLLMRRLHIATLAPLPLPNAPTFPPHLYCCCRTDLLDVAVTAPQLPLPLRKRHTTTATSSTISATAAKLSPPPEICHLNIALYNFWWK